MRGGEERQTATGIRKKGSGVRQWLMLDGKGETEVVEAGKHAIMRRTGLPARDLRILDPLLSYPSTLLGRERAIVINLEHIKAIITAHEVLLLNSRDPSVNPFVQELQARILRHHQAFSSKHHDHHTDSDPDHDHDPDAIKILPFEFVALEACLEAACSVLENEAKTLEQEAHPALNKLTSKISTLNLERVRQIKKRLVAITGRVQKVRDELEHLLDDDDDMAEMYLTDKLAEQQMEESSSASSINDHDEQDIDDRTTTEISFEAGEPPVGFEDQHNAYNVLGRDSHGTRGSTYSAVTKQLDVEELEMLLEAYFVQIDGTLNKLSTLREYVDDTEDYINIMLDDKQNHLLQMGVMLTTATLVVSAFVVVAGVFGMNIHIELFDPDKAGMTEFLWTVGGSTAGTIFLYVVAIAWCKQKRLLE
ncbi:magnesium transporter MRS2-3 [Vigna umbellata]|uniref:magnesium transporter MRS2-3 n=1 Tax=Vigna umbellata TaxID=87088 RepID=UPI001F5E7123|nr:magnesium transporter MRS2-3 [Vigna umbellata]